MLVSIGDRISEFYGPISSRRAVRAELKPSLWEDPRAQSLEPLGLMVSSPAFTAISAPATAALKLRNGAVLVDMGGVRPA